MTMRRRRGAQTAEVHDCIEALEMFEVFAAEKVARSGTDEVLDRLRGEITDPGDIPDPSFHDDRFRRLLVELSGNTLAQLTAEPMRAVVHRHRAARRGHLTAADLRERHRVIVAAIEARDPQLAGAAMRAHVRSLHSSV